MPSQYANILIVDGVNVLTLNEALPGRLVDRYLASECYEGDNVGEISPGSSTESYPAFARIGLMENPGKNLNQDFTMNMMKNRSLAIHRVLEFNISNYFRARPNECVNKFIIIG
ncbi:hypothetical protein ANN_24388 [Periplaneta americana]|uniref:Per a allergen n=1 Tax=Periplaneta americana TaxID=6978 RepID=A0ABQ8S2Y0_PERAM|nr:hypothetical protein ANN_24388 [Periplaneta americana]